MEENIVVGIDVGTTKICTLVARLEADEKLHILGVGIEPSRGMRKGAVIELNAASQAIARSVEKAEHTSGLEIDAAYVSLSGSQVDSSNSSGVVGISGGIVDEEDVARALEAAQAVSLPHNREIVHVVQRGFRIDGQDGIRMPMGMHGYRLEVETHIITAAAAAIENLRQCVNNSGVEVTDFVLNPLASAEAVLNDTERQMGVAVCDIGGGTTDLAIFIDGDVWHTMVFNVGGNHVTADIAHGLRLPPEQAEEIKRQHGHTLPAEVRADEYFRIRPFGTEQAIQVSRADLVHIIEARMEEVFDLVLQEIKRTGYDGLLPAGLVLTGGGSLLPGMQKLAAQVLGMPVRVAQPENLTGMIDRLGSPEYATSVGLLRWAQWMHTISAGHTSKHPVTGGVTWEQVKRFLRNLLP
ncbi:MAG: cell division protein FtsA [Anaerolineales bacterium]